MVYFGRFGGLGARRSENTSDEKCYLYRSTRPEVCHNAYSLGGPCRNMRVAGADFDLIDGDAGSRNVQLRDIAQ